MRKYISLICTLLVCSVASAAAPAGGLFGPSAFDAPAKGAHVAKAKNGKSTKAKGPKVSKPRAKKASSKQSAHVAPAPQPDSGD